MSTWSDRNIIYATSNDLVVEIEAIFQSLWNLIQTETGSRLFNDVGINLKYYLKKKCNTTTAIAMKQYLATVFAREPRVVFNNSKSTITPVPNKRLFILHLVFNIVGVPEVDSEKCLDLVLKAEGV